MKALGFFEPVRNTIVIAFTIGMGIAFHEVFLLVALVLTAAALGYAIETHIRRAKPTFMSL
jgi:hypothetical protein